MVGGSRGPEAKPTLTENSGRPSKGEEGNGTLGRKAARKRGRRESLRVQTSQSLAARREVCGNYLAKGTGEKQRSIRVRKKEKVLKRKIQKAS